MERLAHSKRRPLDQLFGHPVERSRLTRMQGPEAAFIIRKCAFRGEAPSAAVAAFDLRPHRRAICIQQPKHPLGAGTIAAILIINAPVDRSHLSPDALSIAHPLSLRVITNEEALNARVGRAPVLAHGPHDVVTSGRRVRRRARRLQPAPDWSILCASQASTLGVVVGDLLPET